MKYLLHSMFVPAQSDVSHHPEGRGSSFVKTRTVAPNARLHRRNQRSHHAALLIDSDDLVRLLYGRGFDSPARVIRSVMQRLASFLQQRDINNLTRIIAVGDFDRAGEGLQRALVLNGIEPVHVPHLAGTPALCAMQLGVEATALAHSSAEISTIVLAVGRLVYLPLVQQLQRAGVRVVIVWDREQIPGDIVLNVGRESVVSLFDPAFQGRGHRDDAPPRRSSDGSVMPPPPDAMLADRPVEQAEPTAGRGGGGHAADGVPELPPGGPRTDGEEEKPMPELGDEPMVGDPISGENEMSALRTLVLGFGRHVEVFLTPYLFKLNSVLPDLERFERKAVVMRLEEAGAVKVERRRGVPNDYSVVIVNYNHPTVREILA